RKLEALRRLEDERARVGRGKAAGAADLPDMTPKPKRFEDERAREADLAKLRALEAERAKLAGGGAGRGADRVAELEDRMKRMEAALDRLMAEVERLRKK